MTAFRNGLFAELRKGEGAYGSLSDNIWHVVNQGAQNQQDSLLAQDFQCLVPLHIDLQQSKLLSRMPKP